MGSKYETYCRRPDAFRRYQRNRRDDFETGREAERVKWGRHWVLDPSRREEEPSTKVLIPVKSLETGYKPNRCGGFAKGQSKQRPDNGSAIIRRIYSEGVTRDPSILIPGVYSEVGLKGKVSEEPKLPNIIISLPQ